MHLEIGHVQVMLQVSTLTSFAIAFCTTQALTYPKLYYIGLCIISSSPMWLLHLLFVCSLSSWHGQFITKVVEAVSWMKDFLGCGSQKHNNGVLQGAISTNQFLYHIDDSQNLHTFFCAFSQNSQKHLGLRSVSLILH
jgi:hypothetical protein